MLKAGNWQLENPFVIFFQHVLYFPLHSTYWSFQCNSQHTCAHTHTSSLFFVSLHSGLVRVMNTYFWLNWALIAHFLNRLLCANHSRFLFFSKFFHMCIFVSFFQFYPVIVMHMGKDRKKKKPTQVEELQYNYDTNNHHTHIPHGSYCAGKLLTLKSLKIAFLEI